MKKLLFLPLLLLLLLLTTHKAEAKIWSKDLVDKVTLDSGYKFSLCTVDLNYNRTNSADNIFNVAEKDFEGNPNNYPCNKQSGADILFANITLHFNQHWGGGSAPEKLIEFQNKLYSVDQFGDVLADVNGKAPISDISPIDWFSTLSGIHGIRGSNLVNTDPAAKGDFLPNGSFLIIHDPVSGKFTSALFILNNVVYKISNTISQVTVPTTLVDYTQSSQVSPTVDLLANWKTFSNKTYGYSFKYPPQFAITEKQNIISETDFDNSKIQVTQFQYTFTTGTLVQGSPDMSGFSISVSPTSGKSIAQEYSGQLGLGGTKIGVTPFPVTGNADEEAVTTNTENISKIYRAGNNFFVTGPFQNVNVLPAGSDDISKYSQQVFDSLVFQH